MMLVEQCAMTNMGCKSIVPMWKNDCRNPLLGGKTGEGQKKRLGSESGGRYGKGVTDYLIPFLYLAEKNKIL